MLLVFSEFRFLVFLSDHTDLLLCECFFELTAMNKKNVALVFVAFLWMSFALISLSLSDFGLPFVPLGCQWVPLGHLGLPRGAS